MNIQNTWKFIREQFERCNMRMKEKSYRDAIDIIYDVAGNISNLHKYMEEGNIATDKNKVLYNLSLMHSKGVFSQDFGKILRDKWELMNIAKYGYFASRKIDIKEIEIPETEIKNLFSLAKKMISEFKTYMDENA